VALRVTLPGKRQPRERRQIVRVVRVDVVRDGDRPLRQDEREQSVGHVDLILVGRGAAAHHASVRELRVEPHVDAEHVAGRRERDGVPGSGQVDRVEDVRPVRLQRRDDRLGDAERGVDADRVGVAHDDGVQEVGAEVRDVIGGLAAVVAVLVLETYHRLVDERQAQARDLDPGAGRGRGAVVPEHADLLTRRRRPNSERLRVARPADRRRLRTREEGGRDLERDGVAVEPRDAVLSDARATEVREVEDPSEIDVEPIVARSGPEAALRAGVVDERRGVGVVVVAARRFVDDRVGARSDVDGSDGYPGGDDRRLALLPHRHAVGLGLPRELAEELLPAADGLSQIRRVDVADRRGRELNVVTDDVGEARVTPRDVDGVEDVIRELVEVRATRGLLERVVCRDDVELVVGAGGDPGPDVGVVRRRIERDGRGFSVARSGREGGDAEDSKGA
jgi:hypothetical protein